jgi:hypothetical protein
MNKSTIALLLVNPFGDSFSGVIEKGGGCCCFLIFIEEQIDLD